MVNEEGAHGDMLVLMKAVPQRGVYHGKIGRGKGIAWGCHNLAFTLPENQKCTKQQYLEPCGRAWRSVLKGSQQTFLKSYTDAVALWFVWQRRVCAQKNTHKFVQLSGFKKDFFFCRMCLAMTIHIFIYWHPVLK